MKKDGDKKTVYDAGDGCGLGMRECPSPNFGERRGGLVPRMIVIHYTAMAPAQAVIDRLCDPVMELSAHYLIDRDGTLYRLVDEDKRAWHAGESVWQGVDDINSRSIGVELVNMGDEPFPRAQMDALAALCRDIKTRHDIEFVLGHEDVAPGRKFDPGPLFDWAFLARAGVPNIHEKA